MSTMPDTEPVKKLLCKTIATICREMIDFRVKISIEGLLSIVVDETKVVNVSVQEILLKDGSTPEGHEAIEPSVHRGEAPGTSQMIVAKSSGGKDTSSQRGSDTSPRPRPWSGPGSTVPGTSDDNGNLCRGNGDCIIKNFGCSLVASVASMAEAVSRVSRKPCCSGSASDISRLVDITNEAPSQSLRPSCSTVAIPLTAAAIPPHTTSMNIRPEHIQWPIRLPKTQRPQQTSSPSSVSAEDLSRGHFADRGESSALTSSATSAHSALSSDVSVASPSSERERESDDEDMLCSEGLNCCRLYSDLHNKSVDTTDSTESEQYLEQGTKGSSVRVKSEQPENITQSEPAVSRVASMVEPRASSEAGGSRQHAASVSSSPLCCMSEMPRHCPALKRATPYGPPVCAQIGEASCGGSACHCSCSCCANLAWMRHRDALRTRRCRAKRGLPTCDLDSPKLEPPALPEATTRPCDQSCQCCQILQLRRANARMRRKMYYQKRRHGPPSE